MNIPKNYANIIIVNEYLTESALVVKIKTEMYYNKLFNFYCLKSRRIPLHYKMVTFFLELNSKRNLLRGTFT